MVKMSEAFPSKYLAADDLQGREVRVTIDHCKMEEIGREQTEKPVVYFVGKEKGLVLNKTNASKIKDAYGDESSDWTGYDIILFAVMTSYQGEEKLGTRVKIPMAKPEPKPAQRQSAGPARRGQKHDELNPPPPETIDYTKELNDEVPF